MEMKDIKLIKLLLVIYTPEIVFKKNIILQKMMEHFSEKFDGDIQSLPIPDDAPKEIPRLVFNDSKKRYKFDIAVSRSDFNIFLNKDYEIDTNLDNIVNFYYDLIKVYNKCTKARIGRIALVSTKYIEKENPSNILVNFFCNKNINVNKQFKDLNNFELHFRKVVQINNYKINNWTRIKNTKINFKNRKDIESILIIQDTNTLPEELELKNFAISDLKKFFKLTLKEQSLILKDIFTGV
jgi:hypothetical protein